MNEFRAEQRPVTPANFLTSAASARAHLPSRACRRARTRNKGDAARPHMLVTRVSRHRWEGRSGPPRAVGVHVRGNFMTTSATDLSAPRSPAANPAHPRGCTKKRGKKGEEKGLETPAGLAAFSVFFPWPFHSATSAETSFHSSCSSQLVNSHTRSSFSPREREVERKERATGRGCLNRQLEQYVSYSFLLSFPPQCAISCFYTPSILK